MSPLLEELDIDPYVSSLQSARTPEVPKPPLKLKISRPRPVQDDSPTSATGDDDQTFLRLRPSSA